MDKALEARLLELLDKQEISECLTRYARAMDRLDEELLLSCYHPDGLDHHPDSSEGKGAFCGTAPEFWKNFGDRHRRLNLDGHHHALSNITIEITGDTAHTETYYIFDGLNQDGSLHMYGGRYIDRLEKRDGHWKIAARACINEWMAELNRIKIEDPKTLAEIAEPGVSTRDKTDRSYERPLITRVPRS